MVKKGSLKVFRGKQGFMYAVALLAWSNYTQYQPDFANINTLYTKELAQQQKEAIEAARLQPNQKQRSEVPQNVRIKLNKAAASLRAIWQLLSGLIEKSFSEDEWATAKIAAGSNYYLRSSDENWPASFDLGEAATTFLSLNAEELTAGGMAPDFPQRFAETKAAYDKLYGTLYNTRQQAKDGTVKKRSSNTSVYKATMSMMKDGVRIFHNNPGVREKFVYASLMKLVSGQGFTKTGYEFILKDKATNLPVTTASLVFTDIGGSTYTGKMGKTGILRCDMPEGIYSYTLKAPGYTTLIGNVRAIEGSMRQKTLRLTTDTGTGLVPQSKAM